MEGGEDENGDSEDGCSSKDIVEAAPLQSEGSKIASGLPQSEQE